MPKFQFSFSKQKRLLNSSEFSKTIKLPLTKIMNDAFIIYVKSYETALEKEALPRLGITVTKKNIRKAVQRNTIKRVLRESFRIHYLTLPRLMIVVMSRTGLLSLNKHEVRNKIDILWMQLQEKFPNSSVSFS